MAKKMAADVRVRTNELFLELFTPKGTTPWTGTAERPHDSIQGCWVVRVDDLERLQYLNEKFLEVMP